MDKIELKSAVQRLFAFRPDEAYSFDEVYRQFQVWQAEARRYERGEICVRTGTPAGKFAAVVSGALHVKVPSDLGADVLMRAVRPGQYVGVQQVFAPEDKNPFDVVAVSESEVIVFDVEKVRQWRTDPRSQPLYDYLGRLLCDELNAAREKAGLLSGSDIAERLRRYLSVRMQREQSRTVVIPGTTEDLANYLGVNRSALSRVMSKLCADGKISYRRRVITVL